MKTVSLLLLGMVGATIASADDWPQFRGPNRDGVWSETGIMQTFPPEGLQVRWRAPIGGGHSSPIVGGGRVYVTDSITDSAAKVARTWERVHCFDEKTGKLLWMFSDEIDSGSQKPIDPQNPPKPVATPVADAGLVFTLGSTGHLLCLDALKGTLMWKKNLANEYSLIEQPNLTSCPLVEGGLLIALIGGKPGACVVAFDKRTGKEVWRALDDPPRSFSSPMIISAGGQRQLIVWTPVSVTSLNPVNGQTWWREELATREDYGVATPVIRDDMMLISGLMFRLDCDKPAASIMWPEKKPVAGRVLSHTSMPMILDGHVYAGKMGGRLVCLDARTGKQIWESDQVTKLAHCATIHLTPNGDSVLLFTDQGNLIRARLTPSGYQELSRVKVVEPTYLFAGRKLVWAPPAFANRRVFARNDQELVCASLGAPEPRDASSPKPWRTLPLITDGKINDAWAQVGWGGFVVDDGALRTECDDRGMGLLLYKAEKFGNCQLRVVYRCEKPKSNAGVYVRLDDGILGKIGEKSPEVHRDEKGKLSSDMLKRLEDASNKHLGAWYPVHHGYEVQIMDDTDAFHRTGAIYSLAKADPVPAKSQTEWRTMIITLEGERIHVEVDGKPLSTFDSTAKLPPRKRWAEPIRDIKRPTTGYVGLQNHDPGDVVWFKEVSVRPLDDKKKAGASAPPGRTIRAAAISFVPVKFDLAGNADRLEKAFRAAREGGAKIAIAPEGVLEGYVVNEIISGKAAAERMKDVAVTVDDRVIRRFQNLARELEMCLVFGFAERIADEAFNCAVFIDDTGRICGKHHKMQLAEGSHPDWWFNRLGAQSRAFDTPYGRCGIVICNERWNPQLARILALDGARFLLIPSYGSKSKPQDDAVLLLGRENGVPVVEANVGVTLLVNDGRIAVVDRKEEGITFGDIVIPPAIATQPAERDRMEREFLVWREQEMKVRYEKTMAQAKARADKGGAAATRPNETIQNSIGLKLVRIPAGEFTMGSPPTEKGRRPDEVQRKVRLTRDYFIGQCEVTRGQFRKFVDATGYKSDAERGIRGGYGFDDATQKLAGPDHRYSWRFTGFAQTDDHPVVNVTWNDANAFCRWLSEQEKQTYRLPTEAEWEYACRGGSSTAYCNGDDPEKLIEIGNIMDSLAHETFADRVAVAGRDGFVFTAPVGSFKPNAFGLHDMHGNVWEWTADWFAPPPSTPQTDPRGPEGGRDKVVRGGDWYHDWSFARSAQRYPIHPSLCRRHAGFRIVRDVSR